MSFFNELKRRNVFRVGIAYAVATWVLIQIADILLDNFGAPPWVMKSLVVALAIGFFITLFFAWAFELTPEGVKRESEVDRTQSIAQQTGQKLNFMIIGLLVVALGYFIWESRFASEKGSEPFSRQAAVQPGESAEEKRALTPFPQTGNPASKELTLSAETSRDRSIAVLPFANRSNKEDDLFFTDGIHDDLLTQLAKISGLKVISRTSVMKYKNTEKTIPEIASELGVATILEGGIQRAGNRVRINAQLIEVKTDEHLWAETFDREMTMENIFDIQSDITRHIVTAVKGELSDAESEALGDMPTESLPAYEAYLHAKTIMNAPDYNREKYLEAEVWVKSALENDPEFALAWAMMVEIHGEAIWLGFDDSPERQLMVQDALSKASQYGPFLPETLAARAEYLYRVENNFHEAEIAFRSASEAKPGDAGLRVRLALTERRTGKWEQAVESFQQAIDLDTDNLQARTNLVETLINMGEFERVEPLVNAWIEKYPQSMDLRSYKTMILVLGHGDLEAARNWHGQMQANSGVAYFGVASSLPLYERDYPSAIDIWNDPEFAPLADNPAGRVTIMVSNSQSYMLANNGEKAQELARQAIEEALKLEPESDLSNAFVLSDLAVAYLLTGQPDKALETSLKALALYPESRDSLNGVHISNTHAWIMAKAGLRDEALAEIKRLLYTPAGMDRWDLYLNPLWDFFRDDERFNELIKPRNLEEARS
jgi:TolB-like protein/tetratricopeptide (TPR) repeat protein